MRTACQAEQCESVLTDGEVPADVRTGASCERLGPGAVCRHILQTHFLGNRSDVKCGWLPSVLRGGR